MSEFANPKTATALIWKAIQNLQPIASTPLAQLEKAAPSVKAKTPEPAKGSICGIYSHLSLKMIDGLYRVTTSLN